MSFWSLPALKDKGSAAGDYHEAVNGITRATPAGRLRASREVSKPAIAGAQGLGPQRQSPLRPGASEVILEACLSS
jgi:hypothetical protein